MQDVPELFSSIDGTVTNVDGTTHEFTIHADGNFSQWGTDHGHMSAAWDMFKDIAEGVADHMQDGDEWREEREEEERRLAFFGWTRSSIPDEVWEAHGFGCAIINRDVSAGYVALPDSHPWATMNLQDGVAATPQVHGGVTFGPSLTGDGRVIIGWDAGHGGDASPHRSGRIWSDSALMAETEKLAEQAEEALFEPLPYQTRPERVEVMRITWENYMKVADWAGVGYSATPDSVELRFESPETTVLAGPGDYVVKMGNGRFKLCAADDFSAIFEEVDGW